MKKISIFALSTLLMACGGGGGSSEPESPTLPEIPPVAPVPEIKAPELIVGTIEVNEGELASLSAEVVYEGADQPVVTWSQVSGLAVDFVGDGNGIQFAAPPVTANTQLMFELHVSTDAGIETEIGSVMVIDADDARLVMNNLSPYQLKADAVTENAFFHLENWGLDYLRVTDTYSELVCYPTPTDCEQGDETVFWWQANHTSTGDLNGDGHEDLVVTGMYFPHTIPHGIRYTPFIYLNDGKGNLVPTHEMVLNRNAAGRHSPYHTEVADFNADGLDDILVASSGKVERHPDGTATDHTEMHLLLLSDGMGNLVDRSVQIEDNGAEDFHNAHDLSVGDINGDGHLDFQAGNYVGLNNGDGSFRRHRWEGELATLFQWNGAMSSLLADFNNDGFADIAKFMFDNAEDQTRSANMYLLLSDGTPTINNWQLTDLGKGIFEANTKHNHAATADLNGDGNLDFVIGQTRAEPYYVGRALDLYLGRGDGTFENTTAASIDNRRRADVTPDSSIGLGEGIVVLRDINLDGHVDILDLTSGPLSLGIFLNNGEASFKEILPGELVFAAPNDIAGFEMENERNDTVFFPIDLDKQNGIDFVTTTHVPWHQWPATEYEMVFYEIKSKAPLK